MVSKSPRKQRKRLYNAKLHTKQNMVAGHLSKELRERYNKRSITLRTGDTVEVMRGSHKSKKGKIVNVDISKMKVNVEGITIKRKDGGEVPVSFNASNLKVIDLYKDDEKRFKNVSAPKKSASKKGE
jgi:large subunit ribosomal protein L24